MSVLNGHKRRPGYSGRPPGGRHAETPLEGSVRRSVALDQLQAAEVKAYAVKNRCTFSQAVRELIEFGLETLR